MRRWVPVSSSGGPLTISDNFFSYTNGALVQAQPSWTAGSGSMTVAKGGSTAGVYGTTAATNVFVYRTDGDNNTMSVTTTLVNVSGTAITDGPGPAVRCNNTGGGNGYGCATLAGTIYVLRCNNGVFTNISSYAYIPVIGDMLRLTASGSGASTRLHLEKNVSGVWSDIVAALDPGGVYISSGQPGLWCYGSASSAAYWSNFFATQ